MGNEKCELYIKRTPLFETIVRLVLDEKIYGGTSKFSRILTIRGRLESGYIRIVYRNGVIVDSRFGNYDTYSNGWIYPRVYHFINNDDDLKVHCTLLCSLIKNTRQLEVL